MFSLRMFLSVMVMLTCCRTAASLSLSAEEDWYQCTPGISPSLGVSFPRGDIYLEHGAEAIDLFCHMNPHYFGKEFDSSNLFFEISGRGEHQRIILEQTKWETEIINVTTIRSVFDPKTVGYFDVYCKVDKGDEVRGVCNQRIHVGYPPLPITDFSCISENWQNLNCTWTEPYNPITTKYDVHFKEPGRRSQIKDCPTRNDLEMLLEQRFPRNLKQCYVDEKTDPPYRHPASRFTFTLHAVNPLNPSKGKVFPFKVDHFSIVRPGKPQNLNLRGLSNTSLVLTYDVPNEMQEFPPGLVQHIQVSNQHEPGKWTVRDTIMDSQDKKNNTFTMYLDDLLYAWTNYTVQVKMISAKADLTNSALWSDAATVSGTTLAVKPSRAPVTCEASFQITRYPNHRDIYVYWQQLRQRYHNGPNFRYEIVQIMSGDERLSLLPVEVTDSYAKFTNMTYVDQYKFSVTSVNSEGEAPGSSKVSVPDQETIHKLSPIAVTTIYNNDRNMDFVKISWFKPRSATDDQIKSYTIFWCQRQQRLDTQCTGLLEFATVSPGLDSQKILAVKDVSVSQVKSVNPETLIYSLDLPVDIDYLISVAANTDTASSGMVKSSCTIINDQMKEGWIREMSVERTGSSWLQLRWSMPCSERSGLVTGYIVTWCHTLTSQCLKTNVSHTSDQSIQHRISDLDPWTQYSLTVAAISFDKVGVPSDLVVARTGAAAPSSPPTSLSLVSVSNVSVTVSWDKPVRANGPVSHYRISLELITNGNNVQKLENVTNLTEAVITNLLPYSEYKIIVAGCNEVFDHPQCSGRDQAAEMTFMTKIGSPGKPIPPTISFMNSSIATIGWSSDFQLGAGAAKLWNIRVVSANPEESDVDEIYPVPGEEMRHSIDFSSFSHSSDWIGLCDNASAVPHFNVSIQAVVSNEDDEQFTGPWSEIVELHPTCTDNVTSIVITVIASVGAVVLTAVCLWRSCRYYKRKRDFFEKLGQELDEKYITVTETKPPRPATNYPSTTFSNLGQSYNNFHLDDNKDITENLLREDFSKQRSKESDTTSGCDTGGSDQGTSLNSFNRSSSSNSSQADTDTDLARDIILDKDNTEEEDGDKEEDMVPETSVSQYVDPGTLAGYSKVMNVHNDLGYVNNLAQPTNTPPKPPPTASPYIQLPASNVRAGSAPLSNGYIQIQNVPRPPVLHNGVTSPPPAQELVLHSAENPFYSKVSMITDPNLGVHEPPPQPRLQSLEPLEPLQAVKISPGYIQFPSSSPNPVVISPNKLSDTSIVALASSRANEPQNTIV